MVTGIKHIAIAVKDAREALRRYQIMLGVPEDIEIRESPVTRQHTAVFDLGGVQYQLVESMDADGRYAQHIRKHGEGVHHICYVVDDLKAIVTAAIADGAIMRDQSCRISDDPEDKAAWNASVGPATVCANCGIVGRYEHPEGWVAFLENDGVPGPGIELMQVYKPHEVPEQYRTGPLAL